MIISFTSVVSVFVLWLLLSNGHFYVIEYLKLCLLLLFCYMLFCMCFTFLFIINLIYFLPIVKKKILIWSLLLNKHLILIGILAI